MEFQGFIDFIYYLLICYTIIYLCMMTYYCIIYFRRKTKEFYWNNASKEKIMQKLKKTIKKFDNKTILFSNFTVIKKIYELSMNNEEFRIYCFQSGLKPRVLAIITSFNESQ